MIPIHIFDVPEDTFMKNACGLGQGFLRLTLSNVLSDFKFGHPALKLPVAHAGGPPALKNAACFFRRASDFDHKTCLGRMQYAILSADNSSIRPLYFFKGMRRESVPHLHWSQRQLKK